jgi:hypothetical protein
MTKLLITNSAAVLSALLLLNATDGLAAGPYVPVNRTASAAPIAANSFLGFSVSVSRNGNGLIGGLGGYFAGFNTTVATSTTGGTLNCCFASPASNDFYGYSVGVDPNYPAIASTVIGAFGDDTTGTGGVNNNSGKVYFFQASNSFLLTPDGDAVSPRPVQTGNFGKSVVVRGNFAFVGEPKAANIASQLVGGVHIYERTAAQTWTLRTSILGGVPNAQFGEAIAVSGNTLVIGAPIENAPTLREGATYVYTGAGATWTLQQRLQITGVLSDDQFGSSVDIDGDTIVVGTSRDDVNNLTDAGSAVVFDRVAGQWTQGQTLFNSQPALANQFGIAVSILGDEIAVGADCLSFSNCVGTGSVEVFKRRQGQWSFLQRLTPPDGANGDSFGFAIDQASAGILIGAARAVTGATANTGAVYWFAATDGIFADGFE